MSSKTAKELGGSLMIALVVIGIVWIASQAPKPNNNQQQQPNVQQPAGPGNVQGGPGQVHFGYTPQPQETERFLQSLPQPEFKQAAPHLLKKAGDQKPVFLYRARDQAWLNLFGEPFVVGSQGIGDCVSWGWAEAINVASAVDWKLGKTSEWRPLATESIYGGSRVEARGVSRGGWGDGSYGGAAAKWVSQWGGIFRQPYPELGLDLTTYSAARAKQWGNYGNGGDGDNGRLDKIAKDHPVRQVALVTSFEEAAAAIQSGYPVPVCSGYGFTSQRDKDGFCDRRGSWPHCMCFVAVRFDRPGLLCQNSWGPKYFSGPKWPEDMPDGSFWIDKRHVDGMLSGRDSFAVSDFQGFPFRDLTHGDWVETKPIKLREMIARQHEAREPHYALAP